MSKQSPHYLFLGEVGFPVGFGAIQRQLLIAKGVVESGSKVTVISFKANHHPKHNFPAAGTYEGIHYHYSTGEIHRPSGFLKRNLMKVVGRYKELIYLQKLKRSGDLSACYVSTDQFQRIFLYWIWLKWLQVPLILNYDELMSSIPPKSLIQAWNDRLFDRLAVRFSDGVTPISDYIMKHVKAIDSNIPVLKLPILCDFDKFNPGQVPTDEISFTYCGAASYLELIDFVLAAFDQLDVNNKPIYLDFILGGNAKDLQFIQNRIAQVKNQANIRLHSNVAHTKIPTHYAQATALLIPMRPTVQDAARFPHKLGEYLASGRAIITTRFGEIKHYDFIDEQTALVADTYDPISFAEKMQFVMNHPKQIKSIGMAGRKIGLENFNYKDIGYALRNFFSKWEAPA